jgi:hypothetical protein
MQRTPSNLNNIAASTTAAGTRRQVSTISIGTQYVHVVANTSNTGYVYVGGPDVSSSCYTDILTAGDAITLEIDDADKIWYDVSVNSEGIKAGYLA